jgi:glycosyltransferase involved in cell wall biosynthesis
MNVSVVVPTRNRSALLAMTLRSVLRQQDIDFEVIVVDEASTDDTRAVVAALDDTRVRVIRHEMPLGVSSARNRGAAEAVGDWLAFVDDDDLWAPDKLARQLQAAQSVDRDWAYAGSVNITDHNQIVYGRPPLSPEAVVACVILRIGKCGSAWRSMALRRGSVVHSSVIASTTQIRRLTLRRSCAGQS